MNMLKLIIHRNWKFQFGNLTYANGRIPLAFLADLHGKYSVMIAVQSMIRSRVNY